MAIVIHGPTLWRQLTTKYGGTEDRSGDHPVVSFDVPGRAPIKVRQQHSTDGDLPKHIMSQVKRDLGLNNPREVKQLEVCTFGKERLQQRLAEMETTQPS